MGRWSTDAGSFSWQRVLFGARQEVEDALAFCAAVNTTDRRQVPAKARLPMTGKARLPMTIPGKP